MQNTRAMRPRKNISTISFQDHGRFRCVCPPSVGEKWKEKGPVLEEIASTAAGTSRQGHQPQAQIEQTHIPEGLSIYD